MGIKNELKYFGKNLTYARNKKGEIIRDSNGKPLTVAQVEAGITSTTQRKGPGIGKTPAVPATLDKPKLKPAAKAKPKPPKPSAVKPPASRLADTQPSRPAATRPSAPQTPKSSAGQATPKPSTSPGKASTASETYKEGGKGLYQGTKAYREKIGGSGNPLLNRFREDMGRDASTGKTQKEMKKDVRQAGKAAGEKVKNLGKSGASVDPGYTPSTKITKNYSDKKPSSQPFETQRRLDKAKASPAEKQKQQTQQNRKEQSKAVINSGSSMSLAEKMRRKRLGL